MLNSVPSPILVIAGGVFPSIHVQRALPPAAMCFAADSGLDHAFALGLTPKRLFGDLDSVSPDGLQKASQLGIPIDRHPRRKDFTDLEATLDHAVSAGPDRLVLVAIDGGRADHELANLLLMSSHRFVGSKSRSGQPIAVDALAGTTRYSVIHNGSRKIDGRPGELLSLLPVHGDAFGVTTTGCEYRLDDETLRAGSSRGVSNVVLSHEATVSVTRGTLLAILPDNLATATEGVS